MSNLLRAGLLLAGVALGLAAQAATYYVADCQAGAAAGCVAGSDSNAGTSAAAPWRTAAKVRAQFASLNPDDKILFAQGGVWTKAAMDPLQNLRSSAAHPITFDSYTAAWGSTAKPILSDDTDGATIFAFTDGGSPEPDGGYVVQNLELRGLGRGGAGVFTSQLTRDIMLNNLTISGFSLGVYCGDLIPNVTLRKSTLTDNRNQGVLWSCIDSLIEDNRFDNNGWDRPVYDHSLYLAGKEGVPSNMVVRNNRVTRNSHNDSGICEAVVLVVHGTVDGLLIENNTLYQAPHTATQGCWGIAVDAGYANTPEAFSRITIRGNRVVNVSGIGIGCGGCTAPVIENNVIVQESDDYLVGIQVPDRIRGAEDGADSAAVIRNNSIWFGQPANDSIGIQTNSLGTWAAPNNVKVVSNLIHFAQPATNITCFDTSNTVRSNYAAFDNNLCYRSGNAGRYSWAHRDLAQAKAAGFDRAGLDVAPQLVAKPSKHRNWSLALKSISPALNAGHADSAAKDILSRKRTSPDIGAYEYVAPAAPTATAPLVATRSSVAAKPEPKAAVGDAVAPATPAAVSLR